MAKKGIFLIILMMSVALLGLVGLQAYYISESYKLNAKLFDQSVMTALNNVAQKIEKEEAARFMRSKLAPLELPELPHFNPEFFARRLNGEASQKTSIPAIVTVQPYKGVNIVSLRDPEGNFQTDISFNLYGFNRALSLPEFEQFLENSESVQIAYRDGKMFYEESRPFGIAPQELRKKVLEHQQIVERQLTRGAISREAAAEDIRFLQINANGQVRPISPAELRRIQEQQAVRQAENLGAPASMELELKQFLDSLEDFKERVKVFEELAAEMQRVHLPLGERVSPEMVDSLLKKELQNQGISLAYDVEIRSSGPDSLLFASHHQTEADPRPEIYKTALFPQDVVKGTSGELILKIPNKDRYLLHKMNALTASSGTLILVIVICFSFTLYSMLRQKKLSQMKSDFINNMTHEFKTPVATIMLASEALKDEQMNANKDQVARYAGIIYDENLRLSTYVERVLHMARLEKSDFRLERNIVTMNDLIAGVADSMELQLKSKKASVSLELEAENDRIRGDELHLSNVIFNLIDNAVKYSGAEPQVRIRTLNEDQKLKIVVADQGIGMSREQYKKIFEKFYRAQSGNLHDVKGFGLGLSYVNSIVKLLDGQIRVRSELNKGSEFEITFPLEKS